MANRSPQQQTPTNPQQTPHQQNRQRTQEGPSPLSSDTDKAGQGDDMDLEEQNRRNR